MSNSSRFDERSLSGAAGEHNLSWQRVDFCLLRWSMN